MICALREIFGVFPRRAKLACDVSLLANLAYLLTSYLAGWWLNALEGASAAGDMRPLWVVALVVLSLTFGIHGMAAIARYLGDYAVSKGTVALQMRCYDIYCAEDPLAEYTEKMDRKIPMMASEAKEAALAVENTLAAVAAFLFQTVGSIVLLFLCAWQLGFVAIAIGAISLLFNGGFAPLSRKKNMQLRAALTDASAEMETILNGHEMIENYGAQDFFAERYGTKNKAVYDSGRGIMRISLLSSSFAEISKYLIPGGFILSAAILCMNGIIPVSTVLYAYSLGNAVGMSMRRLGKNWMGLQFSLASAERLANTLGRSTEESHTAVAPDRNAPVIEFDHVSFSYDDTEVLHDVSFSVRTGEKVAIVGRSGSGKSTIAQLCLRMITPTSGRVLLMGHDIREYGREDLKKLMSYVPQSAYVLSGSVYDNIACAVENPQPEDVKRVMKRALVEEFLISKDGKDTQLGENGDNLSGGQKQRIAVARAMLKLSPLLILDEHTSALDAQTAAQLNQALWSETNAMAVLVITHMLDEGDVYDKIIHIEACRVRIDGIKANSGKASTVLNEEMSK